MTDALEQSDTPLTDEAEYLYTSQHGPQTQFAVESDMARKLERDNAAIRAQLAEKEAELAALKAQHSELRNMVEELSSCQTHRTSPPDYSWSECAFCGEEDGHAEDCFALDALELLQKTQPLPEPEEER